MRTTTRTGLTLAGLLAGALLAGCAADAEFNQADVAFAKEMIPHHEQAVVMAELVAERTDNRDLRELAADVEAAQDPEIEAMTAMLDEWGEPAPEPHDAADHAAHDMPGMMSEEQMANLADARGAEFDRLWMEMMIEHHEGAIEMAETQLEDGINTEASELAEDIIEVQEAEIDLMRDMLDRQ
ncbi:DUF305 domain-containing protein [Haloechinothrix sp. LS1_15]|uniref:DUF305 domain-containing protein n=1 Tax=Haloechinothrix sp. LS1_15 TaxID=2652248 RepID=UPI002947A688|nr:DUF305 domain-containing protein [Haloechinothrix sp. LS1_15]MDV6011838.1 DUF305 domain-containing protein [Haloechinothrix sp. LS1_15]